MATCRNCNRSVVNENGTWIDPEATGDDIVWRETCEASTTFTAEHEPDAPSTSTKIIETRNSEKQFETLINYVRAGLNKLDDPELPDRERYVVRDEMLELADFHGGQVAQEVREAGLPA